MTIDIDAALQFIYANARVLDRRRLEHVVGRSSAADVVDALVPYRNRDGGFGHALEPDMRAPGSEPSSTLLALETLNEIGLTGHPMYAAAAAWLNDASTAAGALPQMMPASAGYPHAPFINPGGPNFLTFALAGALWHSDVRTGWLERATDWSWHELETVAQPSTYTVVFALRFLDAVPDAHRAQAHIDRLRPLLDADGTMPVPGGIDGEAVTPLTLSPHPGARSRRLFTRAQITADLDRLEAEQLDDGGWDFDFLHWSAGQTLDWRSNITVGNLLCLHEHDRITLPSATRPSPPWTAHTRHPTTS